MPHRSICSPSPVIKPSMDRPARVLFMSDLELTARSVPGGRGEPAAIRQARPSPSLLPYLLEGGTPNVLGALGSRRRDRLGHGTWPGQPPEPRGGVAPAGRGLGGEDRRLASRRALGSGNSRRVLSRCSCPTGLTPQDLGSILDVSFEIAVRPGLHCAPYIHRALHTFPDGTLRLSPGPFTTPQQIDRFVEALTEITAGVL